MNDRNMSRRRRGMRFRPSRGMGQGQQQQQPDRDAQAARAEAIGGGPPTSEKLYEQRHAHEGQVALVLAE